MKITILAIDWLLMLSVRQKRSNLNKNTNTSIVAKVAMTCDLLNSLPTKNYTIVFPTIVVGKRLCSFR